MRAIHLKRFERMIQANKEAPKEAFDLSKFGYSNGPLCGSPACLVGNYSARTDLQKSFRWDVSEAAVVLTQGTYLFPEISKHFGITIDECMKIFGSYGCNNAGTDRGKALRYVRAFLRKKAAE